MTRKILTLLLTLSLLIGMALPAVAEEGEAVATPIIPNGGFEEREEDGVTATGWAATSGGLVYPSIEEISSAHTGDGYLQLPFGKTQKTPALELAPETHYMLHFWARTTVKDGSYIEIKFQKDDSDYTFINGEDVYFEWFGIENAAPAEGEVIDKLPWQEFSFSFTTPAHAKSAVIGICANVGPGADGKRDTSADNEQENLFCLDDVSLVATGREPNLLRNGYMTAFKVAGKHPSGWTGDTPVAESTDYDVQYVTKENGEVAARFDDYSSSVATTYYYYRDTVYLSPGRYKLSFDFFRNTASSNADDLPWVFLNYIIKPNYNVQDILADGEKNTYEYYFTITDPFAYEVRIKPGVAADTDNTYTELSNIRIWKDETSVQYGKTKEGKMLGHGELAWRDNMLAVSKISDADKNEGGTAYVVLPKGHYIPETNETENFMMVNALYRKYENGSRIFESVTFVNGEATGGVVSNVNDKIEVPVLTGEEDYTYEIQSYLWAGASGMQPVADKTVLTY